MMQQMTRQSRPPAGWAGRSRSAPRWRVVGISIPLVVICLGCSIAPRNFRGMTHPAAITRARSVTLGQGLPESQVIPTLIGKLDDTDPVVRLTAHQELRRRTGQDFDYLPWGSPEERSAAIAKYRGWWDQRQRAGLARTPQKP